MFSHALVEQPAVQSDQELRANHWPSFRELRIVAASDACQPLGVIRKRPLFPLGTQQLPIDRLSKKGPTSCTASEIPGKKWDVWFLRFHCGVSPSIPQTSTSEVLVSA